MVMAGSGSDAKHMAVRNGHVKVISSRCTIFKNLISLTSFEILSKRFRRTAKERGKGKNSYVNLISIYFMCSVFNDEIGSLLEKGGDHFITED